MRQSHAQSFVETIDFRTSPGQPRRRRAGRAHPARGGLAGPRPDRRRHGPRHLPLRRRRRDAPRLAPPGRDGRAGARDDRLGRRGRRGPRRRPRRRPTRSCASSARSSTRAASTRSSRPSTGDFRGAGTSGGAARDHRAAATRACATMRPPMDSATARLDPDEPEHLPNDPFRSPASPTGSSSTTSTARPPRPAGPRLGRGPSGRPARGRSRGDPDRPAAGRPLDRARPDRGPAPGPRAADLLPRDAPRRRPRPDRRGPERALLRGVPQGRWLLVECRRHHPIFGGDDIALKGRQATIERSILAYAAFTIRTSRRAEPLPLRLRRLIALGLCAGDARSPSHRADALRARCVDRAQGRLRRARRGAIHDLHEHWDGERRSARAARARRSIRWRGSSPRARASTSSSRRAAGPDRAIAVLARAAAAPGTTRTSPARSSTAADAGCSTSWPRRTSSGARWRSSPTSTSGPPTTTTSTGSRAPSPTSSTPRARSPDPTRERVAEIAEGLAAHLGLACPTIVDVRRAGLLHDLGKLGVPNTDPRQAGRLERRRDRGHQAPSRADAADPGTGPDVRGGRRAGRLPPRAARRARLLPRADRAGARRSAPGSSRVADVFEALTADRPYRAAMPMDAGARRSCARPPATTSRPTSSRPWPTPSPERRRARSVDADDCFGEGHEELERALVRDRDDEARRCSARVIE